MMRKFFVGFLILGFTLSAFSEEAVTPEVATAAPAVEATAKLAEDQIPLSIETTKKVAETGTPVTKALMSGFIVICLLGTSFYFVRKYRTNNSINKSNMQIKVLSQHYLG